VRRRRGEKERAEEMRGKKEREWGGVKKFEVMRKYL
jgi:hypothetical protein